MSIRAWRATKVLSSRMPQLIMPSLPSSPRRLRTRERHSLSNMKSSYKVSTPELSISLKHSLTVLQMVSSVVVLT